MPTELPFDKDINVEETGEELLTPHKHKLKELLKNDKLPADDRILIEGALERYEDWIRVMSGIKSDGDEKVFELVAALNEYKMFIELEVIWDSKNDFLYRQKGQIKLDNSIIEEFLPWLVHPSIIPALDGKVYVAGPRKAFSGAYFSTTLTSPAAGAGLQIRAKDQDFTVSRPAYLQASWDASFPKYDTVTHEIYLAFVAAECKTNLDKTMFQEAAATAHDVRTAVPGARYYLLCEWLDMSPISTAGTDIEEVIILRGKRLGSNQRQGFSKFDVRQKEREKYKVYLEENPIRPERILRFVNHLRAIFNDTEIKETDVLERGYF